MRKGYQIGLGDDFSVILTLQMSPIRFEVNLDSLNIDFMFLSFSSFAWDKMLINSNL